MKWLKSVTDGIRRLMSPRAALAEEAETLALCIGAMTGGAAINYAALASTSDPRFKSYLAGITPNMSQHLGAAGQIGPKLLEVADMLKGDFEKVRCVVLLSQAIQLMEEGRVHAEFELQLKQLRTKVEAL